MPVREPIVDYYAVLGVHPTAEDIVIRAAYKALAQRYHPDRFPGSKDEAHRRMSNLTKAYEVLADPVHRPKYDRRRVAYSQSFAARFNGTPKYASPSLSPDDLRSAAANRGKYRVAFFALMAVVVVLSTFNLFHYSTRLKGWLGTSVPAEPAPVQANARAGDRRVRRRRRWCGIGRLAPSGLLHLDPKPAYQSKQCNCRGIGCAQNAIAGAPRRRSRRRRDGVGERIGKNPGATTGRGRSPSRGCAGHRAACRRADRQGKCPRRSRQRARRSPGKEPTHRGGIGSLPGFDRRVGPMQSEHDREEQMT